MIKAIQDIHDILPDDHNPNLGTKRGRDILRKSIEEAGLGRAIVIDSDGYAIVGNKTLEIAKELNIPVKIIQSDGKSLIVVQRTDLALMSEDTRARFLSYADNRSNEVGLNWDIGVIITDINETADLTLFFTDNELQEMFGQLSSAIEDNASVDEMDNLTEMSKDDITATTETYAEQYEGNPDLIEVMCPYCIEQFFVNRKELPEFMVKEDNNKISDSNEL